MGETPKAGPALEATIKAKEVEIIGKVEEGGDKADFVTESEVTSAEENLETKLTGLNMSGEFDKEIRGKLKEVKDKWQTTIKGIKENGKDALKKAVTDLKAELNGFTEQKEVKDLIIVFDPFFRKESKASIIKAISFEKYQKGSGHWKAINTRLNAIGINSAQIKAMQTQMKVDPDGKVGPKTMTAMFKMYDGEKGKEVVFDDDATVLLPDADNQTQKFEDYDAASKVIQDAMGGYDEEAQAFKDTEWAKIEAEWAAKYKPDMSLDDIINLKKGEEAAKKALTQGRIKAAQQVAAAKSGEVGEGEMPTFSDSAKVLHHDLLVQGLRVTSKTDEEVKYTDPSNIDDEFILSKEGVLIKTDRVGLKYIQTANGDVRSQDAWALMEDSQVASIEAATQLKRLELEENGFKEENGKFYHTDDLEHKYAVNIDDEGNISISYDALGNGVITEIGGIAGATDAEQFITAALKQGKGGQTQVAQGGESEGGLTGASKVLMSIPAVRKAAEIISQTTDGIFQELDKIYQAADTLVAQGYDFSNPERITKKGDETHYYKIEGARGGLVKYDLNDVAVAVLNIGELGVESAWKQIKTDPTKLAEKEPTIEEVEASSKDALDPSAQVIVSALQDQGFRFERHGSDPINGLQYVDYIDTTDNGKYTYRVYNDNKLYKIDNNGKEKTLVAGNQSCSDYREAKDIWIVVA